MKKISFITEHQLLFSCMVNNKIKIKKLLSLEAFIFIVLLIIVVFYNLTQSERERFFSTWISEDENVKITFYDNGSHIVLPDRTETYSVFNKTISI